MHQLVVVSTPSAGEAACVRRQPQSDWTREIGLAAWSSARSDWGCSAQIYDRLLPFACGCLPSTSATIAGTAR